MYFATIIRRAFAANPRAVPVSDRENAILQARGIQQPTIRSYLAWRRSLMIFVVISTLLSAGLATYREFAETGEHLDVLETIAQHLHLEGQKVIPEIHAANPAEADDEEDPKNDEDAEQEPQAAFAQFTEFVELTALYILPLAALVVVVLWARFQLSFQIMVAAFVFAFLVPLLIGLCPWSWWGYVEPTYNPQTQSLQYFKLQAEGLWEGLQYLVALLPTVLSLVPGVQRACIRVKLLLPQSTLPGWFLVMASPFYALFLLVIFVAINQFHSHPLFFVGMLLFLLAPLCYAVKANVFTKPLSSEEDYRRIRGVQRIVGAMTALAGVLLVVYLATRQALGVHLLGFDYKTSLLVPLDLVEFFLEVISRSMFMTVLGADLLMRINLTAWKNTREFANSPETENYDRVMGEFERIS